jgi:hypothetical protein
MEALMAEKTLFTYRVTAFVYFFLGLVFILGDNLAVSVVFFVLGLSLMIRTNDQVDYLAQNRPIMVWIPFIAVLLACLSIAVVKLVFPLIYR